MLFSNIVLVPKLKKLAMELVIEKPLNNQDGRRLFFLSFLMCLICFNCFASKASAEAKSIHELYSENLMILVDSNLNEVSESELQDLTAPDMESDAGIEQWMYAQFGWKNQDSGEENSGLDNEVPVASQDTLPENPLAPGNDPDLSLESWMLNFQMHSVGGADDMM